MEEKMTNKEKIMIVFLIFLILLFTFISLFVLANKKNNIVEEIPNYYNDVNNYIYFENIDTTLYNDLYENVNFKKIRFKNVSQLLYKDFIEKQDNYINIITNNIENNKNYIEKYNKENNITDYTINSNIDSIILYEINDGLISVLYLIEDTVDYIGLTNYIANIFIDVKTNSILSNEEVLTRYNKNIEDVSNSVFDNFIGSLDEDNMEEILKNKEKYVNIIKNNFSSYIYLYLNENNLYLKYNKSDMHKLLFNTEVEKTKYSTLKI